MKSIFLLTVLILKANLAFAYTAQPMNSIRTSDGQLFTMESLRPAANKITIKETKQTIDSAYVSDLGLNNGIRMDDGTVLTIKDLDRRPSYASVRLSKRRAEDECDVYRPAVIESFDDDFWGNIVELD
jgi:hypothetical protein